MTAFKGASPLILIGFGRLVSTAGVDYQVVPSRQIFLLAYSLMKKLLASIHVEVVLYLLMTLISKKIFIDDTIANMSPKVYFSLTTQW